MEQTLSRRDIWVRLLLYPGHTLPTAAAPVIVAVGLAVHDRVFAPLPALLAFIGSWLIHLGGVFADQYELLRRHPGIAEHPELSQALKDGTLTFAILERAIIGCFALAALTAPYLLYIGGVPALAIGIIGVTSSIAYASGPYPYARTGLADPIFFVMFGIVAVVGTYYAQAALAYRSSSSWLIVPQGLPFNAFVVGLPIGALVMNVLVIDDIRDREFDIAKGWRTGAVRFGLGWSRTEYLAFSAFAYLSPCWFWLGLGFDAWVLLPLLTLPLAYTLAQAVLTLKDAKDFLPMTPKVSGLSLLFSVLLALGIAVSG